MEEDVAVSVSSPGSSPVSTTARDAVFAPLDGGNRADTVARRLSEAIGLGLIADGEQLPSESELAGQLGVSTVTLREALATLRQQGLVETRRGRTGGTFVGAPVDPEVLPLRERLRELSSDDLRDMGDMHEAVAGAAARLAAERAAADEVDRLRNHAATVTEGDSAGARRRADGRFHVEVAAAAQSPRLTNAEISFQADVGALLWLPGSEALTVREAARQHREIAEAVGCGDGVRARRLAEEHVRQEMGRLVELHLRLVRGS
jgi:GntR family transcriptional regulator, transcriptional repressor for pyruvate dehydrogenase complex